MSASFGEPVMMRVSKRDEDGQFDWIVVFANGSSLAGIQPTFDKGLQSVRAVLDW